MKHDVVALLSLLAGTSAPLDVAMAVPLGLNSSAGSAASSDGFNASVVGAVRAAGDDACGDAQRPRDAVSVAWYYRKKSGSAFSGCTAQHDKSGAWIMLNAYQSGGSEGVHWRYTTDVDDARRDCLKQWTYYNKDGTQVLATTSMYSTLAGDTRPWCALPVYRKGGKRGYQWDYCCADDSD